MNKHALTISAMLVAAATNASCAVHAEIVCEPICYDNPQLKSVPLPCLGAGFKFTDWDGDGLIDLLWLSHPRYNDEGAADGRYKLYWLRNFGTPREPRFAHFDKAQLLLSDYRLGRFFCVIDHDGDGRPAIASVAGKHKGAAPSAHGVVHLFVNAGVPKVPRWKITAVTDSEGKPYRPGFVGPGGVDAVSLDAADLDGDGREDLLLGTNHQDVMKHAFGVNPQTHHPTAGRIYFARNVSDKGQLTFDPPRALATEDGPIKCFGFAYPLCVDLNGDGRNELVVGDHQPGVRIYRNVSAKGLPRFELAGSLKLDGGAELGAEAFHLEAADLDSDGRAELIGSTYFGSLAFFQRYQYRGDSSLMNGWKSNGRLAMEATRTTPLRGPGISTPEPIDFDADGDLDLVLGAEPGIPMWAEDIGNAVNKIFAPPQRLKFVDGRALETHCFELGDGSHHGAWEWYGDRCAPRARDWDGDGVLDLVSSTMGRRIYWMKGRRIEGELRF